jgi:fructose-1,6-bisphosphatase/inositol monophosphatase family enzyme
MSLPILNHVLLEFQKVAALAGHTLREEFGRAVPREKYQSVPEGTHPSTSNVVTDLDLKLQRQVAISLLTAFPDFEFYGEEDTEEVFDASKDAWVLEKLNTNKHRYRIVCDPLDGTGRYAARDSRYGLFLGLLDGPSYAVALGFSPASNQLTTAIKGSGCSRNNQPFSFCSSINDAVVLNSKSAELKGLAELLQAKGMSIMNPRHTGTMYDLVFLEYAKGLISMQTNTHDHVLSLAIEEAGGAAMVYNGKEFVPASEFNWRSPRPKQEGNLQAYIAAKDRATAEELISLASRFIIR